MSVAARLAESSAAGDTAAFSYELFLPDTLEGADLLVPKIDRLAASEPLFIDVASGPSASASRAALRLAAHAKRFAGVASLVHVGTGRSGPSRAQAAALLDDALAAGVRSVFVDAPLEGEGEGEGEGGGEGGGGGGGGIGGGSGGGASAPPGGSAAGGPAPPAPRPTTTPGGQSPLEAAASSLGPGGPLSSSSSSSSTADAADAAAADARPFAGALDAIRFIRARYGDALCVAVGASPEGEPGSPGGLGDAGARAAAVRAAAAAAAAGASVFIARPLLEAAPFLAFARAAAAAGVGAPIVPSILLLYDAATTAAAVAAAGARVPPRARAALDAAAAAGGAPAYRAAGVALAVELARDLLAAGVPALHFLTLNLESSARAVLAALGLAGPGAAARRKLPWRPSGDEARAGEAVRPIFWANRPASYVARTAAWTAFPGGRWAERAGGGGRAGAADFCEPDDAALVPASAGSREERRALWGEAPRAPPDVWAVFAGYVAGAVPRLPWCDVALLPETSTISSQLAALNRGGFLTINSQPRVNGARSDDATFGWGGPGGHVYQKAYVECFCPPGHLAALMLACAEPARRSITYHAVNVHGVAFTNSRAGVRDAEAAAAAAAATGGAAAGGGSVDAAAGSTAGSGSGGGGGGGGSGSGSGGGSGGGPWSSVVAVTWGVFPDKEILQPTVMDPEAFRGPWRGEAFALWARQWGSIYDEDSPAAELVEGIHDTYFLVNLVDNDFVGGDLFAAMDDALRAVSEPGREARDPRATYAALRAAGLIGGPAAASSGAATPTHRVGRSGSVTPLARA